LGQLAAERLQLPFIELNREIERQNSLPVPEIFAIYGQEGFRRFEQACLSRIVKAGLFGATGGGIVAAPMTLSCCCPRWTVDQGQPRSMTRCTGVSAPAG
jgi:XRE family aerobic/anaerobic benzoate catabolism transcriptional regulator